MNNPLSCTLRNGEAVPLSGVPELSLDEFRGLIIQKVKRGARLASLFGAPGPKGLRLFAILAFDRDSLLAPLFTTIDGPLYPSLTPECHAAHLFEREIAEQWGVTPTGHPWLKPVRFHPPFTGPADADAPQPGTLEFFHMDGNEVHEVAVGPVHAGIIEPGHFRFQCHGETVYHLEISLGYQHRGIERRLCGGPDARTLLYMETASGDTTAGHSLAYCQLMEALSGTPVSARAESLRGVALELERLANHVGDLGALANDVAFLPTASFCGRIRGDFLNLTALLCGNRFGRGLMTPGGVRFDAESTRVDDLLRRLNSAARDTAGAVKMLWKTTSVLDRFEGTGVVTEETARLLGLVGPAARASGLERDVRFDHPAGIYRFSQIPVATHNSGDVFARAFVRWLEIQRSIDFIRDQLTSLPQGSACSEVSGMLPPDRLAVSLVEGWRGEIVHVALTDGAGRFDCYKITDPSFHNWTGLSMALRNGEISDFPLCNKSLNLSYCGHDL